MNRQDKKRLLVPALAQNIQGLNPEFARALAKLDIISPEDLRDADLDFIIAQIAGLEYAVAWRWQRQAFLQTLFAGMTARSAGVLVDSGIVSIPAMAQVNGAQLKKTLPGNRLRAWKFIASHIPADLVPEKLGTAREVEPLPPPQAVALYAQGIKTAHDLRSVNPSSLNFNFLPATNKRTVALWQYLAALRLDYGIGPAYAQQLHRRYNGDRDKIHRRLEREREKALEQISRTRRNRGPATPPDKEAVADFFLEPVCRDLADTIPQNKRRANRTLKHAQQWGSAHEISGRLVRCLADDPALDKEAVIPWMLERNLTSKRGLLDLVTQVVVPEKGKKDLVGALVDQWGLGALVNLGKDSPQKNSLGSFLIDRLKTGGEDWTKILPDALKLLTLGSGVAEKLLGQLDLEPARLITELFKSNEREKESGLSAILKCFQGKQNFNQLKISTIFELYKEGKNFVQPFVQHLFKSGMESMSRFEDMLEIPLTHAGEQNAKERDGIFAAIFKAVSTFGAETEGGLETMLPKLIDWVRQTNERELVPVVEDGLIADNRDIATVPLGVHLLGKGIQALADDGQENAPANRFTEKLFQILPWNDELEQEIWLHLAKIPGMLFVLLTQLLWKAIKTPMRVFQWIGQDANAIRQKDRELAIHILEPPDEEENRKYVILSDIHRDAPDDLVDATFFDLSHFSKHRDLFIRALEYYRDNGYIVIENGDCEELWLVPSVRRNKGVRARAQSIIAPYGPHHRIYELLAELHREGRYFRTRGNHDDFWALAPENEAMLRETWFNDGPEFKIWDALIIPEVLTMNDDYLGVIKNVIQAKQKKAPLDMEGLVDLIPIGLSPKRYHERVPLFILHGHQFDFWNCDEHSYLGKTLANSIGIIADGISTFPYHLRGIDLDGNPLVKFTDLMAKVPQVENWLPEDHALRLSRQIEQEDEVRLLQDSIYYCETLVAAFALALKYPGHSGLLKVQILVGHTHWPQSRPALHLGCIKVPNTDSKYPLRLPTPYFNSGTCGWWESVLWGVEITSFGQPKLFYWDKSSEQPNYMSWELHNEIPEYVDLFRKKVAEFLAKCFNTTTVLEDNTQNMVTWEQIDDFSDLHEIDFGSLDPSLHGPALSTAQIWALRFLGNRDQTSQSLEIALDLNRLTTRGSPSQKFSFISEIMSNPNLVGMTLKTLGIGKEWKILDPQDARYQKISSLFFYAAHFLKNSLCNKLGLLLNLFISRGREIMVRYEVEKNRFFVKLGKMEKLPK